MKCLALWRVKRLIHKRSSLCSLVFSYLIHILMNSKPWYWSWKQGSVRVSNLYNFFQAKYKRQQSLSSSGGTKTSPGGRRALLSFSQTRPDIGSNGTVNNKAGALRCSRHTSYAPCHASAVMKPLKALRASPMRSEAYNTCDLTLS